MANYACERESVAALGQSGGQTLAEAAAIRLLDLAKSMGVTSVCTCDS